MNFEMFNKLEVLYIYTKLNLHTPHNSAVCRKEILVGCNGPQPKKKQRPIEDLPVISYSYSDSRIIKTKLSQ